MAFNIYGDDSSMREGDVGSLLGSPIRGNASPDTLRTAMRDVTEALELMQKESPVLSVQSDSSLTPSAEPTTTTTTAAAAPARSTRLARAARRLFTTSTPQPMTAPPVDDGADEEPYAQITAVNATMSIREPAPAATEKRLRLHDGRPVDAREAAASVGWFPEEQAMATRRPVVFAHDRQESWSVEAAKQAKPPPRVVGSLALAPEETYASRVVQCDRVTLVTDNADLAGWAAHLRSRQPTNAAEDRVYFVISSSASDRRNNRIITNRIVRLFGARCPDAKHRLRLTEIFMDEQLLPMRLVSVWLPPDGEEGSLDAVFEPDYIPVAVPMLYSRTKPPRIVAARILSIINGTVYDFLTELLAQNGVVLDTDGDLEMVPTDHTARAYVDRVRQIAAMQGTETGIPTEMIDDDADDAISRTGLATREAEARRRHLAAVKAAQNNLTTYKDLLQKRRILLIEAKREFENPTAKVHDELKTLKERIEAILYRDERARFFSVLQPPPISTDETQPPIGCEACGQERTAEGDELLCCTSCRQGTFCSMVCLEATPHCYCSSFPTE